MNIPETSALYASMSKAVRFKKIPTLSLHASFVRKELPKVPKLNCQKHNLLCVAGSYTTLQSTLCQDELKRDTGTSTDGKLELA